VTVRWGWIDRNPAERAQPPPLGHVELQVPTVEEVQALLSAGAKRNERWGMLLSLAVLTGARRGELCALRWTDIEGERIRIRRSPYRAGTDRGEKSTKGGVSAGSWSLAAGRCSRPGVLDAPT
jgi:integrase